MSYVTLKEIRTSCINIESLEILKGELLVLIGPSGAGKTSLLNIIAGFSSHGGTIVLDGQAIESTSSNRRRIGYLFQELYLFPHLTVFQNLKIAMRRQALSGSEKGREIRRVLALFRIDSLAGKYPDQLSGGEKQRVAMARTISSKPKLLLLDEPFSHLDYKTARYLRNEFRAMQKELQITTLFVTHNLQEGKELGDRIAVMEKGRIVQLGNYDELWRGSSSHPHHFIEKPNILEGFVQKSFENGLVAFRWNETSLLVVDEGFDFNRVIIWPEDIQLLGDQPANSVINCIQAELKEITDFDHITELRVQVKQSYLKVVIDRSTFLAMGLKCHDRVYLLLRLWCLRGYCGESQGVAV